MRIILCSKTDLLYSIFWVVHLYTCSTTHLVSKATQFLGSVAVRATKMSWARRAVLAVHLTSNTASSVVCLMFVVFLHWGFGTRILWKSPPWEILLRWRVCWCFWHIATWAYSAWCWNFIFKTLSASSVSECVLRCLLILWLLGDHILGAWVCIIVSSCHTWLSSNLWSGDTGSTVIVCLDWVI